MSTQPTKQQQDDSQDYSLDTEQFIDLMFGPDEIISLVVLHPTFPGSRAPCGFYVDSEAFLAKAKELTGQGDLYVNINRLDKSVLDRGINQFNTNATRRFTGEEITRRCTLVIDVDPERETGTNSTDEELRAAVALAKKIAGHLRECWNVEPLMMISGNGAQLLYRIDEPTESDIVKKVLHYLDQEFSDDQIKVDTSMVDIPRITRLPGTLNMKGEHSGERPQRYATIVTAPDAMEVVTTEQLEALLPAKDIHNLHAGSVGTWDHEQLRSLLENQYAAKGWGYRLEGKVGDQYDENLVYKLEQCPFVEHAEKHAYRAMVWLTGGVPCFKCFSPDCDGVNKKTFRDFLEEVAPELVDDRPEIIITTNEEKVVDQAVDSLARIQGLYQRGGALVRIARNAPAPAGVQRAPDAPSIALLPRPTLREKLASSAKWIKVNKEGNAASHPPAWAVAAVEARTQWPVPVLEAIANTPFLRADGTIAGKYGYDELSGVFCDYDFASLTLPSAQEACDRLLALICDFPFTTEQHRAAWIAGLLTPLAKHAFAGPSPLFLVDANTPGTGKSLLMDVLSLITTGRPMSRMSAPSADDEWRKRITSLLLSGESLVLIDNIDGTLGSPSLDAALTGESWQDRMLGENRTVTLPLTSTWFATGNNVMLARDTARRTLHIRMDTGVERPEERTDFEIPNLPKYVREHRQDYVAAALAILFNYCEAGRPDMKLAPWGSFEGWSGLVRSSIVWAGLPDPGETRTELARQSDSESELVQQLIAGWGELDPRREGVTIASAVARLNDEGDKLTTLRDVARSQSGRNVKQALTYLLRKYRGRIVGGKMIENRDQGNVKAWFVIEC